MSATYFTEKRYSLHNIGLRLLTSSASTQGLTLFRPCTPSMAGYKIFMILPFTCSMSVTTLIKHCKLHA